MRVTEHSGTNIAAVFSSAKPRLDGFQSLWGRIPQSQSLSGMILQSLQLLRILPDKLPLLRILPHRLHSYPVRIWQSKGLCQHWLQTVLKLSSNTMSSSVFLSSFPDVWICTLLILSVSRSKTDLQHSSYSWYSWY